MTGNKGFIHIKQVTVKEVLSIVYSSANSLQWAAFYLRGPGGVDDPGKVKIEFSVVSDRRECQLPDAFYRIRKYCS